MFKIAFIYPAYENLGIEYLSASLKESGFDTRLFLDPILFLESGFIKSGSTALVGGPDDVFHAFDLHA
ncbi:MAG: hypothetical protein NC828_03560, partial [Candidatus Omnitrophica bacterium]|nr:hypothetical protein [Candidatus Omnitrophota bacterium]